MFSWAPFLAITTRRSTWEIDMARLQRLEALLGAPVDQLTEAHIAALVTGGVREDTDLDFKQTLYGHTDSDKRDLTGDVAAMANTIGGAVILGIEDVETVATNLHPVPLTDAEELRMRQIVAGNVAPHVPFAIHPVPTVANPADGYYVLEIPRSPAAPHAVVVNNGLRYPRRDGASTRWLIESEVADAYRNRYASAHQQEERLAEVRRQGDAALPPATDHSWLSLALVPNTPGSMEISLERVDEMRNFPLSVDYPHVRDSIFHRSVPWPSTGHRRVVLNLNQHPDGTPYGGVAHLHQDGAAYVGVRIGKEATDGVTGASLGFVWINDEWLTQEVVASLAVVGAHAVRNTATSGDAAVEVTLISSTPMALHQNRSFSDDQYGPPTAQLTPSKHTIALDDVVGAAPSLLAVTRLVLTDVVQGFGLAEPLQLTSAGGARRIYWNSSSQARLADEARRCGFDVT